MRKPKRNAPAIANAVNRSEVCAENRVRTVGATIIAAVLKESAKANPADRVPKQMMIAQGALVRALR